MRYKCDTSSVLVHRIIIPIGDDERRSHNVCASYHFSTSLHNIAEKFWSLFGNPTTTLHAATWSWFSCMPSLDYITPKMDIYVCMFYIMLRFFLFNLLYFFGWAGFDDIFLHTFLYARVRFNFDVAILCMVSVAQ